MYNADMAEHFRRDATATAQSHRNKDPRLNKLKQPASTASNTTASNSTVSDSARTSPPRPWTDSMPLYTQFVLPHVRPRIPPTGYRPGVPGVAQWSTAPAQQSVVPGLAEKNEVRVERDTCRNSDNNNRPIVARSFPPPAPFPLKGTQRVGQNMKDAVPAQQSVVPGLARENEGKVERDTHRNSDNSSHPIVARSSILKGTQRGCENAKHGSSKENPCPNDPDSAVNSERTASVANSENALLAGTDNHRGREEGKRSSAVGPPSQQTGALLPCGYDKTLMRFGERRVSFALPGPQASSSCRDKAHALRPTQSLSQGLPHELATRDPPLREDCTVEQPTAVDNSCATPGQDRSSPSVPSRDSETLKTDTPETEPSAGSESEKTVAKDNNADATQVPTPGRDTPPRHPTPAADKNTTVPTVAVSVPESDKRSDTPRMAPEDDPPSTCVPSRESETSKTDAPENGPPAGIESDETVAKDIDADATQVPTPGRETPPRHTTHAADDDTLLPTAMASVPMSNGKSDTPTMAPEDRREQQHTLQTPSTPSVHVLSDAASHFEEEPDSPYYRSSERHDETPLFDSASSIFTDDSDTFDLDRLSPDICRQIYASVIGDGEWATNTAPALGLLNEANAGVAAKDPYQERASDESAAATTGKSSASTEDNTTRSSNASPSAQLSAEAGEQAGSGRESARKDSQSTEPSDRFSEDSAELQLESLWRLAIAALDSADKSPSARPAAVGGEEPNDRPTRLPLHALDRNSSPKTALRVTTGTHCAVPLSPPLTADFSAPRRLPEGATKETQTDAAQIDKAVGVADGECGGAPDSLNLSTPDGVAGAIPATASLVDDPAAGDKFNPRTEGITAEKIEEQAVPSPRKRKLSRSFDQELASEVRQKVQRLLAIHHDHSLMLHTAKISEWAHVRAEDLTKEFSQICGDIDQLIGCPQLDGEQCSPLRV